MGVNDVCCWTFGVNLGVDEGNYWTRCETFDEILGVGGENCWIRYETYKLEAEWETRGRERRRRRIVEIYFEIGRGEGQEQEEVHRTCESGLPGYPHGQNRETPSQLVENITGEVFEPIIRERREFLSGLVSFGMEIFAHRQERG